MKIINESYSGTLVLDAIELIFYSEFALVKNSKPPSEEIMNSFAENLGKEVIMHIKEMSEKYKLIEYYN